MLAHTDGLRVETTRSWLQSAACFCRENFSYHLPNAWHFAADMRDVFCEVDMFDIVGWSSGDFLARSVFVNKRNSLTTVDKRNSLTTVDRTDSFIHDEDTTLCS